MEILEPSLPVIGYGKDHHNNSKVCQAQHLFYEQFGQRAPAKCFNIETEIETAISQAILFCWTKMGLLFQ